VAVSAGEAVNLAPGSYGAVSVKPNAKLSLSAGTYYFASLDSQPNAAVSLDKTAGPITITIQSALTFKNALADPVAPGTAVLVQYWGTAPVVLQATFSGTFVAPQASVELGAGTATQNGIFIAGSLTVKPQLVVTRVPFDSACP
jgi:hypothetical protein